MVGGRKNIDINPGISQVLYPEWIHNMIDGGEISVNIEDEDDMKIAR